MALTVGLGEAMTVRSTLYWQLAPEGWRRPGLSPANKVLCALIILGGVFAVAATEREAVALYPSLFRVIELLFAVTFTVEYAARVYAAGEVSTYRGVLGRVRYMLTPAALIDLAATIPLYIAFLPSDTALLRLFRLLGIIRFAKLGRYSRALLAPALWRRIWPPGDGRRCGFPRHAGRPSPHGLCSRRTRRPAGGEPEGAERRVGEPGAPESAAPADEGPACLRAHDLAEQ